MKIRLIEILNAHVFKNSYTEIDLRKYNDGFYYEYTSIIDPKYVEYMVVKGDWHLEPITTTLGRYLNKFYNLSPADITHICEKIKSIIEEPGSFKIIEGDDIANAYFYKNYVPNNGTLSNSCMRFKKCQVNDYFGIYKDCAKMLIMTPKRGKRILGRALLWKYKDGYLMDRVYSAESYIEHQFYAYAKQQGWGILNSNKYVNVSIYEQSIQQWLLPDDDYKTPIKLDLKFYLKDHYDYFPFVDSLCYYDPIDNAIQTKPCIINDKLICLHRTDGYARKMNIIVNYEN